MTRQPNQGPRAREWATYWRSLAMWGGIAGAAVGAAIGAVFELGSPVAMLLLGLVGAIAGGLIGGVVGGVLGLLGGLLLQALLASGLPRVVTVAASASTTMVGIWASTNLVLGSLSLLAVGAAAWPVLHTTLRCVRLNDPTPAAPAALPAAPPYAPLHG